MGGGKNNISEMLAVVHHRINLFWGKKSITQSFCIATVVVEVVDSPMHINVDSIFERERQPDGVVMEILLILEVIAAKRMQPFTVGLTDRWMQLQSTEIAKTRAKSVPGALRKSDFLFGDIFWLKRQTYADGNIPVVDTWVYRQM